jgi:organic radical activating enzyme
VYNDIKLKLDTVGPGFCLEKWTSAVFHLQRGVTNSCHHCKSHTIPLEEVKKNLHAIHNTPYKKEQRKIMIEGGRPSECNYCWAVEDQGGISDRLIVSEKPRNKKHYDSIVNDWSQDFKPSSIDVSFGNTCNLACSYCGPHSSNTWIKDIEINGPYPNGYNPIPLDLQTIVSENPYTELFWNWFKEVYPTLNNLILNGGEPLMLKDTYRCLEHILENPNSDLHLTINSNLCVEDKLIDRFIKLISQIEKGKHVASLSVYTSNEAANQQAEYIRHGLNYSKWLLNINKVLNSSSHIKMGFMATFNLLSTFSFLDLLKDVKNLIDLHTEERIIFMPGYLRDPSFLSIRLLPDQYRFKLLESLDYINNNFNNNQTRKRFEQVISYYDSGRVSDYSQLKDFISEYDKRRELDFKKTFPEFDWLF